MTERYNLYKYIKHTHTKKHILRKKTRQKGMNGQFEK